MKKFKRAFCTNTRLMGTMMLMVEWLEELDIDREPDQGNENRNIEEKSLDFNRDKAIVSHVFILDAEGLGISDLYILRDMDQETRDLFYRKKYGGLGGVNIDLTEDQVAYLVKKYRRKNEWYKKPLPDGFEEVYQDFYEACDTKSVDASGLFDSLCKEMESEYEFVNYMVMRFVARDWDGLPIPASTITGRSISSIKIWIKSLVTKPLFDPIGDPSGIIQAAPAFLRSLATFRSGYIYGITIKPSLARISVALIVSWLSGSRYFESLITSIFTKSPQPHSLDSLAILTASSAFLAPDVFGRRVTPLGI